MSSPIRWVRREIESWQHENLISEDQAQTLLKRYPEPAASNLGLILFAGFGALIIGLGIILLLAYNWQAIPRGIKLAIILGSIAAAHGTGLTLIQKQRPALGEAICLLGTMLFGAGIWLIAQVYHIDEHYPNGLLIWSLGAMALAWTLPSLSHATLAAVLVTTWCGMEAFDFHRPMHAGPLLLAGWIGLLALKQKSRFLLSISIPALFLSTLFVLVGTPGYSHAHGGLIISGLLNFGIALVALSYLFPRFRFFESATPILGFYGRLIALGILYLLTFPHVADDLLRSSWATAALPIKLYYIVFLALSIALWLRIATDVRIRFSERPPFDQWIYPFTAVVVALYAFLPTADWDGWVVAIPFNLALLALIIALMTRGCRQGLLGSTVAGALLLLLLTFSRYFDLFGSLLVRGLLFILIGVAIFIQGLVYHRAKRRKGEDQTP
jgi:uncharacterized membrane protein